uniref:Uncharacterized protein n=1 Tax=Aegilops tauschii subsp. strangulata TaxID=200361 RepID=A0A453T8J5_AEGTS
MSFSNDFCSADLKLWELFHFPPNPYHGCELELERGVATFLSH